MLAVVAERAAGVELAAAAAELDAAASAAAASGTFDWLLLFDQLHQLQLPHHWNLLLVLLLEPAFVAGCC